ncbi:MAG: hypothetical protein WAV74_08960 [Anaerolineae bacterium]|jgi:hypothetical protein
MKTTLRNLSYEVELEPGERLSLPEWLVGSIGSGHWVLIIKPFDASLHLAPISSPIRDHTAFLSSYAPEDEGLYDDYAPG